MLKEKLKLVPNKPGCYLMKNKDGVIIYVGKAKKLKNRLNSYFRGVHTGKTARLVSEIVDFTYMVVNTETESLILELNLIKKYDPKYNILLKDDKSYPYIELTNEEVPKLQVVRNVKKRKKNKSRMFGPYPNVTAARETVNLLNRIYPLRKCNTYLKKPCLYYHINQCLGYCTKKIDNEIIRKMENEIIRFLKGDTSIVVDKLKSDMYKESEKLNFERAKELKEHLDYIEVINSKQRVEINDNVNRDIFGFYMNNGYLSVHTLFIRGGKILGSHNDVFPLIDLLEEELTRYIAKFYDKALLIPTELLVPNVVDEILLSNYLQVNVKKPLKGNKLRLIEMASLNAKINLNNKFELIKRDEERTYGANEELREILNLDTLDHIELFDNSNLFGSYNVSGMVVYKNGHPSKNDYRKFKISIDKNDDYNTMREVIYRRYFRVLSDELARPNLIIVDGGIGQINAAREIIRSLNLDIMVVGLKKDQYHSTNALLADNPIIEIPINKRSNLFYYLERMQDEVHKYTINYHKQIRSKGSLESILDNINGIGNKRKSELLKKYHTITKLKELSKEELESILPSKVASELYEFLKEYN